MDIFNNYSDFNRFMVHNGISVDHNACNEYTLQRAIINKLDLQTALDQSNCDKNIYMLMKKIEQSKFDVLRIILDEVDNGATIFELSEKYRKH